MAPYSRDTAKQNLAYAIVITLSISLMVLLSLMTL
jgi:hypothetical protein